MCRKFLKIQSSHISCWHQHELLVTNQVRACPQSSELPIMDSRNRVDCGERLRTSAVHWLDKWVNASEQTTVHEGSYPSTVTS